MDYSLGIREMLAFLDRAATVAAYRSPAEEDTGPLFRPVVEGPVVVWELVEPDDVNGETYEDSTAAAGAELSSESFHRFIEVATSKNFDL